MLAVVAHVILAGSLLAQDGVKKNRAQPLGADHHRCV
jgi:hypothetical protein